jgi:hypothetical protein
MNILSWRARRPVVIVTAVIALIAAVCGGMVVSGAWPGARASSAPGTQVPGTNVRVLLPGNVDPGKYHVRATVPPTDATKSLSSKKSVLTRLSPLYDFHSSPVVPKGTQLRFVVRKGLKPGMVFEAYYSGKGRWVHEPTTYDPATGVAIATVAHFSVHGVFTWGVDQVKALLEGALKNMFGALAVGQPPTCRSASGVVMYDSNKSDSVMSCREATIVEQPNPPGNPGAADIVAKLVNNRHYPMEVGYPSGASATTGDHASVAQQIGAAITRFVTSRPGRSQLLLTSAAKANVTVPQASPQFAHVKMSTTLDGEAYLVGLLQTGVDELSQMTGVKLATLTRNLIDGLAGEEVLYRISTELTSSDLSLDTLKTLGDVGLDALKVALDNSGTWLAGLASVIVSLGDDLWQSVSGGLDTISGQTYHEYTFRAYGPLWNPTVDLHSVDWARMAIPGGWFTGPSTVQLHPDPQFPSVGMATDVPSHIQGHVPNEPQDVQLGEDGPINVIYGDLGGAQVAAAPVSLNASGGGTADAQRGTAYLIYRAGSSGPVFIGIATSEAALPGAWAPNPKKADHTDLVTGASFQNGTLVIQEDFYGPSDVIAGPTGKGYTAWSLQGGELSYQNHITQPAAS